VGSYKKKNSLERIYRSLLTIKIHCTFQIANPIIYNYQNEPNAVEEITLNEHKGTAWIKFDLDSSHFEGKYYTDKRPIESTKAVCNYGRIEGLKNSV